ncbi:IclR family transcriptional regulator [Phytoactinopolyspora limicola]|uniref:IclR family transcriptional regulator n=1 Tax=Phytoactinopolyspora limicola TaxID=2715536 RepID=UPI001A9C2B4D|nr:IclR family transcriptional regulator [Phytoactinopolyspora limicola]
MVPERRGVRSVDRALDILTAFSAAYPRLQLRELADIVGLPKPSTHRIAVSLIERGFLRQDADGAYSLGSRLLELGGLVSNTAALAQMTRDAVNQLARETGETVLVAEADWMDRTVLITNKRDATHPLAVTSPVGKRSALSNGCIGKAILGHLDPAEADELVPQLHLASRTPRSIVDHATFRAEVAETARRGFATESNEFIDGVAGVAAAVSVGGRPLGAVAIVVPASRAPRRRLDQLGRLVLRALAGSGAAHAVPAANTNVQTTGGQHRVEPQAS